MLPSGRTPSGHVAFAPVHVAPLHWRKFEKARAERPEVIDWFLRIIARLYMLEKPLRDYKADATVRFRFRQNRSLPLMNLLEQVFKRLINIRIRPKSALGLRLDFPWAAQFRLGHRIGFGIANNFLFGGVPFEFAASASGDVAEVARSLRAIGDFHRGLRAFARLD